MKINRIERHNITRGHPMWKWCDEYCLKSKNMYNYANWFVKQEFYKTGKVINIRNDLDKQINKNQPYKDLGSQMSQRVLFQLEKNWKSYLVTIKDYTKNHDKYSGKPKTPKYLKKDGRNLIQLKNIQFRIEDGYIRFSLKSLKQFNGLFKTKVKDKPLQIRIVPMGNSYVLELVYETNVYDTLDYSRNIVSIDLGINNFATVVNNIGVKPFIINGKEIKSYNQYWNKKISHYKSIAKRLNRQDMTNRLQKLTDKRYWKMENFMHKASRYIIDWCIKYEIDTLIVGHNKEWKQESKLYSNVKQNFIYIPYNTFIQKLKYKCENYGIKFIEIEESYTSGTSFLDLEQPIKENYNKDRRIKRGLFKSDNGLLINSDVNGAFQIMKKVFSNMFNNIDEIMVLDLIPVIVNL